MLLLNVNLSERGNHDVKNRESSSLTLYPKMVWNLKYQQNNNQENIIF